MRSAQVEVHQGDHVRAARRHPDEQGPRGQGCARQRRLARHRRATAKALADHGADVTISYAAAAEKAEAVVRDLQSKGVRAAAFKNFSYYCGNFRGS